jgi:hypothetical protein
MLLESFSCGFNKGGLRPKTKKGPPIKTEKGNRPNETIETQPPAIQRFSNHKPAQSTASPHYH